MNTSPAGPCGPREATPAGPCGPREDIAQRPATQRDPSVKAMGREPPHPLVRHLHDQEKHNCQQPRSLPGQGSRGSWRQAQDVKAMGHELPHPLLGALTQHQNSTSRPAS